MNQFVFQRLTTDKLNEFKSLASKLSSLRGLSLMTSYKSGQFSILLPPHANRSTTLEIEVIPLSIVSIGRANLTLMTLLLPMHFTSWNPMLKI